MEQGAQETVTERWHLTYPETLVRRPVVTALVRDWDLVVDIRRADVDTEVGWMMLEAEGAPDRLEGARAWLEEQGITVSDPRGDVVVG